MIADAAAVAAARRGLGVGDGVGREAATFWCSLAWGRRRWFAETGVRGWRPPCEVDSFDGFFGRLSLGYGICEYCVILGIASVAAARLGLGLSVAASWPGGLPVATWMVS